MDSVTLREERAKLVAEARKVYDSVEKEGRTLNGEENEKWERLMSEADKLGEKINTVEKKEATERAEAELNKSYRKTSPQHIASRKEGDRQKAMRSWLMRSTGKGASAEDLDNASACGIDLSSNWMSVNLRENRALSNGVLNVPDFGQGFDRALRAFGGAKNLVKNWQTATGVTVSVPTVDDTANQAVIVAEAGSVAVLPDPTFAAVNLGAFKYSSRAVQISVELLMDSVIPLESLIAELIAERMGRAINAHITVGTGVGQPNGLTTRATTSGVVVGGTVASPTFNLDNILDLVAAVDPAYRNAPGAGFMMNDNTAFRFRRLKDSTGQYLWQPSIQAGQPDRLAGYPVYINQDMPSLAANSRLCLFGDYSRYIWREVMDVQFYRLDELFALNGQVAFHAFYRGDGNLINTSAVRFMASPAS